MTGTRLSDRLVRVDLGVANCYLWIERNRVAIVDAGPVGSGPRILDAVRNAAGPDASVDALVLTHFHEDHAGGAAEIVAATGATVFAGAADAVVVRAGSATGPLPHFTPAEVDLHAAVAGGLIPAPPCRVDVELVHGSTVDLGRGAAVISTPGHTDGSIALHLPHERILFTGDIAAGHRGHIVLGPFNTDRAEARRSFLSLPWAESDLLCFGHGDPLERLDATPPALLDPFGPRADRG